MPTETLKLSKVKFQAGKFPGDAPLQVPAGTVTILAGPNNSGKSLTLREIEDWCLGTDVQRKVVDSIEAEIPSDPEETEELLRAFETDPPPNQAPSIGGFWIAQHTFRQDQQPRHFEIQLQQLKDATEAGDLGILRPWLLASYTIRLDGRTRFSLVDPKETGDLLQPPQNHLWALFQDDRARRRVQELTSKAFGLHFLIDATGMKQFRIRMGDQEPPSGKEQSLDQEMRNFMKEAEPIQNFSDGVQAFVGLTSALMSLPHRVILLDEPEAFLHPTLTRRLANNLSALAKDRGASMVVATHSSEFVIGCLETLNDVSVVRLTYERGVPTARMLESATLSGMMKDPLLRSTGVLRALFNRAVVVSESDTDRAFYDEINHRLLSIDRGIQDALFISAQNVQTVWRIVKPLREIGIPAVAIVDLDAILLEGSNWTNLMSACEVTEAELADPNIRRAETLNLFSGFEDPRTAIKNQGIDALDAGSQSTVLTLLQDLAEFGLFLVPVGELEHWLSPLAIEGHASEWLLRVFERIGHEEDDEHYVEPGEDDVWRFVERMASWVESRISGPGEQTASEV